MVERDRHIVEQIISSAEEARLPRSVLAYPVSVDTENDTIVSLQSYISVNLPEKAAEFGLDIVQRETGYKSPYDLIPSEKITMTIARLIVGGDGVLAVGGQSFTRDQQIEEVNNNSPIGRRIVETTVRGAHMQVRLVEEGKVTFEDRDQPRIKLQDIDF
jgi:hypothetical protein